MPAKRQHKTKNSLVQHPCSSFNLFVNNSHFTYTMTFGWANTIPFHHPTSPAQHSRDHCHDHHAQQRALLVLHYSFTH